MDFNTEKKGYSRDEVDGYIRKLVSAYEQALSEQKQRIFDLKRDLTEAEAKLDKFREQRNAVSKALESAVSKAEEIDRLSQKKYREEMEQLRAFHDKWLSYYDHLLKKYPLDDELLSVAGFNRSMEKILVSAGLPGEQYRCEKERLEQPKAETQIGYVKVSAPDDDRSDEEILKEMIPDLPEEALAGSDGFNPMERVKAYLSKHGAPSSTKQKKTDEQAADDYADRSESGFSFDEALHPTQDLESIMRDLGLIE